MMHKKTLFGVVLVVVLLVSMPSLQAVEKSSFRSVSDTRANRVVNKLWYPMFLVLLIQQIAKLYVFITEKTIFPALPLSIVGQFLIILLYLGVFIGLYDFP